MDEYLIFEFTDKIEAQNCLLAINEMAADYWQTQGYIVIDGASAKELVGKKDGLDAPDSTRTITWDSIKQSPYDTYYYSSLSNDPRFSAGTAQLKNLFSFTEKALPAEWQAYEPE